MDNGFIEFKAGTTFESAIKTLLKLHGDVQGL